MGLGCCGRPSLANASQVILDLDALAEHNKIEHDASLFHADTAPGEKYAPTTPDVGIINDVLRRAPEGLSLKTLAAVRVDREDALATPLPDRYLPNAVTESGLVWFVLHDRTTGLAPVKDVRAFVQEERFPKGFKTPTPQLTGQMLVELGNVVAEEMAKIRAAENSTTASTAMATVV